MSKVKIDEIDLKILDLLQENARISNADIARKVHLVPSATLERVRRLEKLNVISGYHATVNPTIMEYKFLAFVYIKTETRVNELLPKLLLKFDEIQEIHHVAGDDCFLLKIRAKDTPHFSDFLHQVILKFDGVRESRSIIVMDTSKESMALPMKGLENE